MKQHDQVFLGCQLKKEEFLTEQFTGLFDDLLDPEATQPSGVSPIQEAAPEDRQADFEILSRDVRALVAEVNQSIGAAQVSDDVVTRKRELETARTGLADLQALAEHHPSVKLERLREVTLLIEKIARETDEL